MTVEEAKSRCFAEIDLDALDGNYLRAKAKLPKDAELICVLKANAYGLGARQVSKELNSLGANFFAVACMFEAEEIREVLPDADILVMGMVGKDEALRAIKKNISLTVFNKESANLILKAADEAGKRALVHIKLDTGLHRLGFTKDDYGNMLSLAADERVEIKGLYTHLALRDRENDLKQFELFDKADELLKGAGVSGYMRHACDSIGMVRYPERHMDAVRVGAWLYGVCPYRYEHPEEDEQVVMFKTRVSDLHYIKKGECIGYDDEHPLSRDSAVATLSAGYVDGAARLNNKGYVLIRGKKAPILGLVCMDQMMADVTDIPGVKAGDEVTLIGDGLPLKEYAAMTNMNHNECLARIGRRVPRIYTKRGEEPRAFKGTDV